MPSKIAWSITYSRRGSRKQISQTEFTAVQIIYELNYFQSQVAASSGIHLLLPATEFAYLMIFGAKHEKFAQLGRPYMTTLPNFERLNKIPS